MTEEKVDSFLMASAKFFEPHHLELIKEKLLQVDSSKSLQLMGQDFKDPTTMLIVSILGGQLGIDRFLIGDVGLGVGKLLTCGGFGIWAIIDWFMIRTATKEKNVQKLEAFFE